MSAELDLCIQVLGGLVVGGGLVLLLGAGGRDRHFAIRVETGFDGRRSLFRRRRSFRRDRGRWFRYLNFRRLNFRRLNLLLHVLGYVGTQLALCSEQPPVRYLEARLFRSLLSHLTFSSASAPDLRRSVLISVFFFGPSANLTRPSRGSIQPPRLLAPTKCEKWGTPLGRSCGALFQGTVFLQQEAIGNWQRHYGRFDRAHRHLASWQTHFAPNVSQRHGL